MIIFIEIDKYNIHKNLGLLKNTFLKSFMVFSIGGFCTICKFSYEIKIFLFHLYKYQKETF
jgi:hypothetical protein